jgi:hypothetical protein
VHAGVGQGVGVRWRAQQVRLHRGSEPIAQAIRGDVEHARQHRVRPRCLLSPDLHPPASGQGTRDGRQALRDGRRVRAQRQGDRSTDSQTSAAGTGRAPASAR